MRTSRTIISAARRRAPSLSQHATRIPRANSILVRDAPRFLFMTSLSRTAATQQDKKHGLRGEAAWHESNGAQETNTPMGRYRHLLETGALKDDGHQVRIIEKLQKLHDQLAEYTPPPIPEPTAPSVISRLLRRPAAPAPTIDPESVPRGLYLFGDVGTGKTMLMDLFYATLPPNVKKKQRVHFHAFMLDVHKRVHEMNMRTNYTGGDQITHVARDLAEEANVLCFDEFQVTDITDAMILKTLIESLLKFGVVCVFTSNRHPDDLYKNGIQRSSFVPAIELLKERFDVTDLDSGTDYRRVPRALSRVYFSPLNDEHRSEFNKLFKSLAGLNEIEHGYPLKFWGRVLKVPEAAGNVARFPFKELCGKPLSAADYLEICQAFDTLFVADVPKMGIGEKDQARRFINFIDACYENKIKLFVSSEVSIFEIFSQDQNTDRGLTDHMRSVMDDLGLSPDMVGTSPIFTGDEEIFAFARACSRLVQMGSKEWAESSGSHAER